MRSHNLFVGWYAGVGGVVGEVLITASLLYVYYVLFTRGMRIGKGIISRGRTIRFTGIMLRAGSSVFVTKKMASDGKEFVVRGVRTKDCLLYVSNVKCASQVVSLSRLTISGSLNIVVVSPRSVLLGRIIMAKTDIVGTTSEGVVLPATRRLGSTNGNLSLLRRVGLDEVRISRVHGGMASSNRKSMRLQVGKMGTRVRSVLILHARSIVHVRCRSTPNLQCKSRATTIVSCVMEQRRANNCITLSTRSSPRMLFKGGGFVIGVGRGGSRFNLGCGGICHSMSGC